MPMNMGIHREPMAHAQSAFLDSRLRGNDGGMFFPRKRPKTEKSIHVPTPHPTPHPLLFSQNSSTLEKL